MSHDTAIALIGILITSVAIIAIMAIATKICWRLRWYIGGVCLTLAILLPLIGKIT